MQEQKPYIVPLARLNYSETRGPDDFSGPPHKDSTYPTPCEWIVANATKFYFTNRQILAAAQPRLIEPDCNPHSRLWAIYFLIKDGEIVYVGQSTSPSQRMEQHKKSGTRFDSVTWFEAPAMFLNDIEAFYIWRCNPPLNNKWPNLGRFGETAKLLDKKHGEKRNDAEYVTQL